MPGCSPLLPCTPPPCGMCRVGRLWGFSCRRKRVVVVNRSGVPAYQPHCWIVCSNPLLLIAKSLRVVGN
jgi:hypothetical protein